MIFHVPRNHALDGAVRPGQQKHAIVVDPRDGALQGPVERVHPDAPARHVGKLSPALDHGAKPLPAEQIIITLEALQKGPEDFHAAHGAPDLGRKRGRTLAKFFRKALERRVDVQPDPDDHVIDVVDLRRDLDQDAGDLLAPRQDVVGPLDGDAGRYDRDERLRQGHPGKQGHLRRLGRLEPGPQDEGQADPLSGRREPAAAPAAPPSRLRLGDDKRPLDGPRDGQVSGEAICRIHFLLENDLVPQALRPQRGLDLGGKEPVEGLPEQVTLPRRGVDDVAFVSQAAGLLPDRRARDAELPAQFLAGHPIALCLLEAHKQVMSCVCCHNKRPPFAGASSNTIRGIDCQPHFILWLTITRGPF